MGSEPAQGASPPGADAFQCPASPASQRRPFLLWRPVTSRPTVRDIGVLEAVGPSIFLEGEEALLRTLPPGPRQSPPARPLYLRASGG